MKIFHFADSHFSSKRLDECSRNFKYMIDYVRDTGCTVAVCAGDLFDKNTMINSPEYLKAVEYISELSNIMPVYIVRGNHDPSNSLDIFKKINNVFVYDNIESGVIVDKNGESVKALFMPYINPAIFASNTTIKDLYDSASEYYKNKIREFAKEDGVKVVVSHISVLGAELGNSEKIVQGEVMLTIDDFDGVDAVLLGHIHNHKQRLLEDTNIQYTGSHYRMRFGEKGVPGFIIWDIGDGVRWEFVKTPAKEMVEVRITNDEIRKFINGEKLDIDVKPKSDVKVIVDIDESLKPLLDKEKLNELFPECNVTQSIKTISVQRKEYDEMASKNSLSQKFALWCKLNDIDFTKEQINFIDEMEQELGGVV